MKGKMRGLCLISTEVSRIFCMLAPILTCFTLEIKSNTTPFLFLAVDLPPPPLFQDSVEKNIIPQVNIASVLSKYDGVTTQVCL